MQGKLGLFFILRLNQLLANYRGLGNADTAQVCLANKNLDVQISPSDFTCQVSEIPKPKVRNDYTYTPGVGYHKFHTQAKSWNEARKVCFEEGGHLVIINSSEEEKVLRGMYKENLKSISKADTSHTAYVGAHDQFETGEWLTIQNEPISSIGYKGWASDCYKWGPQPDSTDGRNCAAISHSCEGMSNHHCTKARAFFCEIPDKCS